MDDTHVLVITRTVNAPREKVWAACTQEELLMRWWGQPKEAVMPFFKLDFRVEGSFHFMVELPDDMVIWGKSVYKEIVEPEKLVFDEYFSNEHGDLLESEDLTKSLITLTLEEDGQKTILTVRHEGLGVGAHTREQYKEGWGESLDRLTQAVS